MVVDNLVFFRKTFIVNGFMIYRYFGVKRNSYMGDLVRKIYDFYCKGAKNLFLEYKKYYRKEFASYNEFLSQKYNLFESEIEKLSSKFLYCKDIGNIKDYGIEQLCENEEIRGLLFDFLEGKLHED